VLATGVPTIIVLVVLVDPVATSTELVAVLVDAVATSNRLVAVLLDPVITSTGLVIVLVVSISVLTKGLVDVPLLFVAFVQSSDDAVGE